MQVHLPDTLFRTVGLPPSGYLGSYSEASWGKKKSPVPGWKGKCGRMRELAAVYTVGAQIFLSYADLAPWICFTVT